MHLSTDRFLIVTTFSPNNYTHRREFKRFAVFKVVQKKYNVSKKDYYYYEFSKI